MAQFDERLREARRENDAPEGTGQALADALKLQQNTQQRAAAPTSKRGRRRKGQVIDLNQRTFIKPKRRRGALMVLLTIEAAVAVIAVAVLVVYMLTRGPQLS